MFGGFKGLDGFLGQLQEAPTLTEDRPRISGDGGWLVRALCHDVSLCRTRHPQD